MAYEVIDKIVETLENSIKHITRMDNPVVMSEVRKSLDKSKKDGKTELEIYSHINDVVKNKKQYLEDSIPDRVEVDLLKFIKNDKSLFDYGAVLDNLDDDGNITQPSELIGQKFRAILSVANGGTIIPNMLINLLDPEGGHIGVPSVTTNADGIFAIDFDTLNIDSMQSMMFVADNNYQNQEHDVPSIFSLSDLDDVLEDVGEGGVIDILFNVPAEGEVAGHQFRVILDEAGTTVGSNFTVALFDPEWNSIGATTQTADENGLFTIDFDSLYLQPGQMMIFVVNEEYQAVDHSLPSLFTYDDLDGMGSPIDILINLPGGR